jgi:hypothetical protein
VAEFYDTKVATRPHPTGEYIEWSIRGGGGFGKVATYVPVSEEIGDLGQLPKG